MIFLVGKHQLTHLRKNMKEAEDDNDNNVDEYCCGLARNIYVHWGFPFFFLEPITLPQYVGIILGYFVF